MDRGWRLTLPAAGAALAVVVVLSAGDPGVRRTTAGIAWIGAAGVFGADLVGEAVVRSVVTDGEVERSLIHIHQLSMAATSVLLAPSVARTRRTDAVELGFDRVANLEPVVASALRLRSVSIALAGEHGGWLDPTGRSIAGLAGPTAPIVDASGESSPCSASTWLRWVPFPRPSSGSPAGTRPRPVASDDLTPGDRAQGVAAPDHRGPGPSPVRDPGRPARWSSGNVARGRSRPGRPRPVGAALQSDAPRSNQSRGAVRDLDPVAAGGSLAVAILDIVEGCPARGTRASTRRSILPTTPPSPCGSP